MERGTEKEAGFPHYCTKCENGYKFTLNKQYCVLESTLNTLNCDLLHD